MHFQQLIFLLLVLLGGASRVLANVDLLYFRAESSSDAITLVWETETELDNLGFNLWRSQSNIQAEAVRVNSSLIPSQVGGQPIGALYEYVDSNVQEQITYYYWLESVDVNGNSEMHGPVQAALGGGSAISTPVPGGGGQPTPIATNTPRPANTATANATAPAGITPTSFNPTAPATSPTTSGSNPTATQPANSSQPTIPAASGATVTPADFVRPTDNPTAGGDQPDEANGGAETTGAEPVAAVTTPGTAGDTTNTAPVAPTATFIAGEEIPTIGEQNEPASAGQAETDPGQPDETPGWRTPLGVIALLVGVLLTAGGGFALWMINRRRAEKQT